MRDTDWMRDAACAGEDPEMFFPKKTGRGAQAEARIAIEVCQACPVMAQCRQMRKVLGGSGVWAGALYGVNEPHPRIINPKQRMGHGTESMYKRERELGVKPCRACTNASTEASRVRYLRRQAAKAS